MATKNFNTREPFRNTMTDRRTGRETVQTVSLGEAGTATAVFSRPRPTPLNTTAMIVTKTNIKHGGPGGECYRLNRFDYVGTKFYAYSTGQSRSWNEEAFAAGNIAATKAASNMSRYGFGESIAELGQTRNMIIGRIGSMSRFADNVRKGLWSKKGMRKPSKKAMLSDGSKRMANYWLEFQYGWTPLINDIYDLLQIAGAGLATKGMKVGGRSSHTVSNGGATATATAGIEGVVRNATAYNLNQYGLLNPWLLAWELTTLSFVFDWFIPVSRTLGALTARAGLQDVVSWEKDHHQRLGFRAAVYCSSDDIEQQVYDQYIRRTSGVFIPRFYNKGAALAAGQVGSAVALLRQRV